MLPENSGNNGWATEVVTTELLYPRNDVKTRLTAKSFLTSSDVVWRIDYLDGLNIRLYDDAEVEQLVLPVNNVVHLDLAFDQLDREVIIYELAEVSEIWLYWYDPLVAAHVQTLIASGNRPCCMIDERRGILIANSDIFLFYQRGDEVFYRVQRDRYLIEYTIPQDHEQFDLETCGMGTNNRMTIRTNATDKLLVGVGDKFVGINSDYVGFPWGVIPWDRN